MKTCLLSTLILCIAVTLHAQPGLVALDKPTVHLLDFSAKKEASGVQLKWSSENELKLSHFTLEKSLNGKAYNDCAVIFGAEIPENAGHFSFKDSRVTASTKFIYYRLKIVETSGAVSYSHVYKIR